MKSFDEIMSDINYTTLNDKARKPERVQEEILKQLIEIRDELAANHG